MKTNGIAAALITIFSTGSAAAEEPATPRTTTHDGAGGHVESSLQLNPSVAKIEAGAHYRHSWLQAGGGAYATDSYVAPALQLRAYFGSSFSLKAEYAYLKYTVDDRGATHRATLTPNGRFELGPVLFKMKNDISYFHMTDAGEEHFLTDYDSRVKKDDVFLASRTDILVRPWRNDRWASGFGVGPSLQSTWAIRTSLMRARVGGTVSYTIVEDLGMVKKPSIVLDAGINARDEYHEGEGYGAMALSTEF